jgi:putative ABC transport system ATP-binding protein
MTLPPALARNRNRKENQVLRDVDRDSTVLYELKDVSRRYGEGETQVMALRATTLEIHRSEFVAVAGPSGSGKSTLLQLLGALDRPSSGEVRFEGRDLSRLSDRELAKLRLRAFGFVFQQFNLIPTLNAEENVEVALAPAGIGKDARRARTRELLDQVGLGQRRGHLPTELSGGEQQRVAIARALANEPRVLLADEPTGNLDSTTGQEVLALLRRLSVEHDQTVVLVTHDPTVAEQAPRLLRMSDGRVFSETGRAQAEMGRRSLSP